MMSDIHDVRQSCEAEACWEGVENNWTDEQIRSYADELFTDWLSTVFLTPSN